MSRAVNMSIVSVGGFIFDMSRVDGDTTGLFFRCFVNLVVIGKFGASCSRENLGNGCCERRFTVIDVT